MVAVHFAEPLVRATTPVLRPMAEHGNQSPETLDLASVSTDLDEPELGLRLVKSTSLSHPSPRMEDLRQTKSAPPRLLPEHLASHAQSFPRPASQYITDSHSAASSSETSPSPLPRNPPHGRSSLPPQAEGHNGGESALDAYRELTSAHKKESVESLGLDPYEPLQRYETTIGQASGCGSKTKVSHQKMDSLSPQNDPVVQSYVRQSIEADNEIRRIGTQISVEEQTLDDLQSRELDDDSIHERLRDQGIDSSGSESTAELIVNHQDELRTLQERRDRIQRDKAMLAKRAQEYVNRERIKRQKREREREQKEDEERELAEERQRERERRRNESMAKKASRKFKGWWRAMKGLFRK